MTKQEQEAFGAMRGALNAIQRRNVVGIYDSSHRPLFPEFIGIVLIDFHAARAALALADAASDGGKDGDAT